jgi:hypothetical protein
MTETRKREIYGKTEKQPKNVRFEELCKAAELFGFRSRWKGGLGKAGGSKRILNFQDVKGKTKPK